MSDTTKKRLKFAGKLLFICLLLGILYYSFRDSMGDMLTELAGVSPQVVLSLFVTVILYHIFEGHITWLIVHKTHPEYPRLKGFCNAFYCSFYKTATLGSGSGIAGIYYLNKAGIPVPNATGMYFFQYIVHKVSMAVYSLLLFLATYGFIHASFADYQCYILLGFAGVCVIAGVLLAVATVPGCRLPVICWPTGSVQSIPPGRKNSPVPVISLPSCRRKAGLCYEIHYCYFDCSCVMY